MAGAGAVGLLLGLRLRVPSVVAASVLILVGTLIAIPVIGLTPWTALAGGFGSLCALQGGYIVGLLLWCAATRVRWPVRLARRGPEADDQVQAPAARTPAAGGN